MRHIPAHIRGAIARDLSHLQAEDGTPAIVAMGMVTERVRCTECGFLKDNGRPCAMCPLLEDGV